MRYLEHPLIRWLTRETGIRTATPHSPPQPPASLLREHLYNNHLAPLCHALHLPRHFLSLFDVCDRFAFRSFDLSDLLSRHEKHRHWSCQ